MAKTIKFHYQESHFFWLNLSCMKLSSKQKLVFYYFANHNNALRSLSTTLGGHVDMSVPSIPRIRTLWTPSTTLSLFIIYFTLFFSCHWIVKMRWTLENQLENGRSLPNLKMFPGIIVCYFAPLDLKVQFSFGPGLHVKSDCTLGRLYSRTYYL